MGHLKLWHRVFNVVTLATVMIVFHIGGCIQEITFHEEANTVIGVIMQLSERGNGVFDCGSPIEKEVVKLEAMKWITSILNQKSETNFLPGISIGLHIYDTCGRLRMAVTQLGEFLPALKGVNNSFFIPSTIKLGLLDDAGLSDDPEVKDALEELQFPLVSLDPEVLIMPAEEKAKAVLTIMEHMKWRRFHIVHSDDNYSMHVAKFIMELSSLDDSVCILSVEQYTLLKKLKSNHDDSVSNANQNVIQSLLLERNTGSQVLAVLHQSSVMNFIESFNEYTESNNVTSVQILFSGLLTHEEYKLISTETVKVYSLSTETDDLKSFEEYWHNQIQKVVSEKVHLSQENEFLWSYLKLQNNCHHKYLDSLGIKSECNDNTDQRTDDDLHIALRSEYALIARQSIVIFARALQNAWEDLCVNSSRQPCSELIKISHQDFYQLYFKDILQNQRNKLKLPKHSEYFSGLSISPNVVLVEYLPDSTHNYITLSKVMIRNMEYGVRILDNNFHPVSSEASCLDDTESCSSCLQRTQSRAIAGRRLDFIDSDSQLLHQASHSTKINVQYSSEDYYVLVPSPQNLFVVGLFSVHKGTDQESLLKCNEEEVDLKAVRQVEAFLWSLHMVNTHLQKIADGLRLGALLIDACDSRVRTMMLTAGLDSFSSRVKPFNRRNILAVVNNLNLQDAKIANDILASLNVTSLSTGQAASVVHTSDNQNNYILQVEAPLSSLVLAIVDVLKYLGWNYISIIYSSNDSEYVTGYKLFHEAAMRNGICIALEDAITSNMNKNDNFDTNRTHSELMNQLVGARARGARAVILWTNPRHTEDLMQAIGQEIAHGSLRREDLFWLIASPDGQAPYILRKSGNVLGGALIFRPHHRRVQEFLHHLQRLHHNPNDLNKNPWIMKYYQEDMKCSDPECKLLLEMNSRADFNTVQAIYAIGAAFAAVFSRLCGNRTTDSSCLNLYTRLDIRTALNQELHRTNAKRADDSSNEGFKFTNEGMGNIPIEILNFRRNFHGRSRALGTTYFERVGQHHEILKNMGQILAYRDSGDEIQIISVSSQCNAYSNCPQCRRRYDNVSLKDWVTMMKPKENTGHEQREDVILYIAATLSVHESSRNPLECGGEISKQGIEQLEAFLWAIDQVNRNNSHLSLAAIALDTCGSIVKTSRDISNFLNREENNLFEKWNNSDVNIVALLAGGDSDLARSVTDAVGHLGIAVIAPQAGGPPSERKKYAPYPLQLAPSNVVHAASLLTFLHHLQWNCFSVMYHQDGIEYEDMFRYLEKQVASSVKLELSSGIPIPLASLNVTSLLRKCIMMLQAQKMDATRIVVLMLPPERLKLMIRVIKSLLHEELIYPGDFTWIILGSEGHIEYSEELSGSIVLQPKAGRVPEFEDHFRSLSLNSNSWNPWFFEFWSNVFHCRGATCHSDLYQDLQSYQFVHNALVVNTINSVLAVSHALGTVKRELCPDGSLCKAMRDIARVRRRLFEVAPHMAFVGVGLNAVAFSNAGENSHADIEVLNIHHDENKGNLISLGYISTTGKVHLDLTKIKTYVMQNRTEKSLQELKPQCQGSFGSGNGVPHIIEIGNTGINRSKISLLGVAPVHQQGNGHFSCGKMHPTAMLHLAALHYALSLVNHNSSILPGIDVGLILFDSCSRPSRAYNSIYNFLSFPQEALKAMTIGMEMEIRPNNIVAAIISDSSAADTVNSLLQAQNIPHLVVPVELFTSQRLQLSSETSKESLLLRENLVQAMASVARATHSHSVVLVHDRSAWAELLNEQLQDYSQQHIDVLCLGGIYALHSKHTKELIGAVSSTKLMVTDDIIKTLRPGTMVILLLEDQEEIRAFMEVCQYIKGLVFLTVLHSWDMNSFAGHTIFTLHQVLENDEITSGVTKEFQEWFISNIFSSRDERTVPFPSAWFNEFETLYGQNNNSSNSSQRIQQLFSSTDFVSGIQDSINSISSITTSLHNFFSTHCAFHFQTKSFSECFNFNSSAIIVKLRNFLHEELLRLSTSSQKTHYNTFSLWVGSERIGTWEKGIGLMISNTKYFQNFIPVCIGENCTVCDLQAGYFSKTRHSVLYESLQYPWAAALGGLSLFGAFMTILTALYFLAAAALPNNNMCGGTSVLGYLILLGLLLLFTSNLSFILTPTEATCGARRVLPGLAYTVIFSGMLLKVFTTWRITVSAESLKSILSRPTGLLTMAVALIMIQVLLTGGWLLLLPPQVYMLASKDFPIWRCYPKGHFESHLLLSLVYVILLITATATIALLCCSGSKLDMDDENHLSYEARWILLASILVATVFTFWGIVTIAMITPSHSDLASVVAHTTAAKILLLCLYVPKVCLYNRLRSGKSSNQTTLQHFYEISHFRSQTLKTLPAFIPPPPLINMDLPVPRITDGISDDNESQDDPTQVIPSSLYSLDMFSQSSSSQGNTGRQDTEDDDDDDDDGDDDDDIMGEHCEAGTNEFTAPQNTVILVDSKEIARHEAASYM